MIFCPLCEKKCGLVWKERNYKAYRCRKCGVIFLNPLPENSSGIYGEEYFRKWYITYYSEREKYISGIFSRIEKIVGRKGKLLDVGCGVGILMDVARARGWHVTGQDISHFAVEYCRQKGFEVHDRPLPEIDMQDGSFDMITLFDVIAHLKDPVSYLRTCRRLLKPGGHLVIKTPYHPPYLFLAANIFSFTGKGRSLLHIPAQIFHFSKDSFKGGNFFQCDIIFLNLFSEHRVFKLDLSSLAGLLSRDRTLIAVLKRN